MQGQKIAGVENDADDKHDDEDSLHGYDAMWINCKIPALSLFAIRFSLPAREPFLDDIDRPLEDAPLLSRFRRPEKRLS